MTLNPLMPYTGNASFAARNAAFQAQDGQRFFVRPDGWADVRVASVAALDQLGLKADTDWRPGGTSSSKIQIRWTKEVVETLGYEFHAVVAVAKADGMTATDFMLRAASK